MPMDDDILPILVPFARATWLAARGASRAGIRPALHPTSRRCSSLKYDPIFSVVAPGDLGASPVSVLRRHFHHGLLAELPYFAADAKLNSE